VLRTFVFQLSIVVFMIIPLFRDSLVHFQQWGTKKRMVRIYPWYFIDDIWSHWIQCHQAKIFVRRNGMCWGLRVKPFSLPRSV